MQNDFVVKLTLDMATTFILFSSLADKITQKWRRWKHWR